MNTLENNTLIAQFMGAKKDQQYLHKSTMQWHMSDTLKFHSDWNWLMEVVDKINHIISKGDPMDTTQRSRQLEIRSHVGYVNLKESYKCIVEFIKWYNTKNLTA